MSTAQCSGSRAAPIQSCAARRDIGKTRVAPHIFESAGEAELYARDSRKRRRSKLLDCLVRKGEQLRRHGESQGLCSAQIDDELECGSLYDRQIARLLAFENAATVDTHLLIGAREARAVAHQSASDGEFA